MKRLLAFLRPLCHSHPVGLLIALLIFVAMSDLAAAEAMFSARLGFRWQPLLLAATPILCVVGCLIVFLLSPVANCSQYALVRGIGRIPVLGRYAVFVGFVVGATSLGILFAFPSIESLEFSGNIPEESLERVQQEVGEGFTFQWSGGETRVFFLKEKRAAVEFALEKEHILAEE